MSALICLLTFQMWSVPKCQWLLQVACRVSLLVAFMPLSIFAICFPCQSSRLYWRCFVVFLPCKKIFSNHSITGCWVTEVMFFFCHKGIISTAGIMHVCMLGKEGFYHLRVESPCGMKKSFPLIIFVVVIVAVIF